MMRRKNSGWPRREKRSMGAANHAAWVWSRRMKAI